MLCLLKRDRMSAANVQVVRMGQIVEYNGDDCNVTIAKNGRRYLNYGGARFKFVFRSLPALYGVAKHSKYDPKLSLIIRDQAVIDAFAELSNRVKDGFGQDESKTYKPFLLGDATTRCVKLVIKIPANAKCVDGSNVQGGIMPDDLCSVVFTTAVYEYGQYRGFSHKLESVKVVPASSSTLKVL